MKMSYVLTFIISLNLITGSAFAQNDYWKVFFPGYDANNYTANVDHEDNLNLVIASISGQPNLFTSLDKNGYAVFTEQTSEIALLNIRDSSNNRYLVSYLFPGLRIKKYDAAGSLVFNQVNNLSNPVMIGPSFLNSIYFVNAVSHLLTTSGKIAISGLFKTDTSASPNYESLSVLFIDPATGMISSEFNQCFLEGVVLTTDLQEDSNGNFNVIYYNNVADDYYIRKFNQSGTLLTNRVYGDDWNAIFKYGSNMTNGFTYMILDDVNQVPHLLKLDAALDTVYNIDIQIPTIGIVDFFDANDSSAYFSYDGGSFGDFKEIDPTGTVSCQASGFETFGYKFGILNNVCFSARENFTRKDTACAFYNCTSTFDSNMQQLMYGIPGNATNTYPKNNYPGKEVLYFVSENTSDIPGIIGLIDSRNDNFSGRMYFDTNANCQNDSTDIGVVNQLVRINPGAKMVFTGTNGIYSNVLDTGTYTLDPLPFNSTLLFCPPQLPLQVADTFTVYQNNDFGVQDLSGNMQDLSITVNQSPALPGHNTYFYLTVNNQLPLAANGVVSLTLDSTLYFNILPLDATDSIVGNVLYWHVNNLDYLSNTTFTARAYVLAQTVPGISYTTLANVTNTSGEPNLINNTDIYQGIVLSSFDPNDKIVVPRGYGSIGLISPADSILKYKIRFQNTGTYAAFKVVVNDTIDPSLDISTFRLLSTSHPCLLSLPDSNVVRFTFEDIMLPDSTTNEALSHGFINYQIQQKSNLPVNTEIRNTAYIYFDYNMPVATNQTLNTIGVVGINENPSLAEIKIYPNPATNELNVVSNSTDPIESISLMDITGRCIMKIKSAGNLSKETMSISSLQEGCYFVMIKTGKQVITRSFIKMN